MHIIVIGAGLAGLTVAIALARGGHEVEILEGAAEITYIGAGIQLSPNASKLLKRLGVSEYIKRYCTSPVDLRMMRWENGEMLSVVPLMGCQEEFGGVYWHIHRADFHRGLLKCSTNLNIKIHLAHRVTCIDPFLSSLTVANSQTFNADLIIASDGLKSVARSVVVGGPSPPVPTGQMVYRVTLPTKKLEGITELQELITIPRNNHWIGPHGTVLSYLLEGVNERLLNLVFTCDSRMEEGADQKVGTAEEVREAFNGWDSRIGQVLEHVENVIEWRLFTHHPLKTWTHSSPRLTLIGDAAHAMTPYLAQGAAMGIEDAYMLGRILSSPIFSSSVTLPRALELYEELRLERTAAIARDSIESRWFTQMKDGEKQMERDAWLKAHPGVEEEHLNLRASGKWLRTVFAYDAEKAVEDLLKREGAEL